MPSESESYKSYIQKITALTAENSDLSSRLYYCSNSGEGRAIRKVLENKIKSNEKSIAKLEGMWGV